MISSSYITFTAKIARQVFKKSLTFRREGKRGAQKVSPASAERRRGDNETMLSF